MLIIAYVRRRRKGIAYARRVATELDAVKLHLAGAQHGTGDEVGVDARAIRDGRPVVVLAIRRHLADEVLALHGVGNGEGLLVAYDLGIVGDVAARLNRASEPGVGPGAGVGDGVGRTVEIILILVIHVCPKRLVSLERTRRRGIRVILILGVLDADPGLTGKRRGRSGSGLRLALLRSGSRHRGGTVGLSRITCGVIALRGARSRTLTGSSVTGTRAALHGSTVRTGIGGSSAIVGRRALAARRSRHGIGNALGALGPHLGRRGAKSHRKSQERYQTALGHAARDRPMATPRGALALVLKHIHLSPIV